MHSHHNGLKTAALLGLLSAIILTVGYWFGGGGGLVFAVVLSLALNAGTYFFSDKLALRSMRARPVTEAEFPEFYQIVRELATEAGQPMPRLYVSPALQPNAFAKASMLLKGPFTRKALGAWGSMVSSIRANAGRTLLRQICAQPRKNRWSPVSPSILAGSGFPSNERRYAP